MGLAIEYRPQTLSEVVGNEKAVKSVEQLLKKDKPPKAFLLVGPLGCGKTTFARIIAKELGAVGSDYTEMDSADDRGIETIRRLRSQINYKPSFGKSRIWLLDEAHKLTGDAQEALLKSLEEPPEHVFFIIATTDPQKLKPTLKSRCVQIDVSKLSEKDMLSLLSRVCKESNIKITKEIAMLIVEKADGHPRNALNLLEKVDGLTKEEQVEVINEFKIEEEEAITLCRALMENKPNWKKVSGILKILKSDPETTRRAVLGYCSAVLVNSGQVKAFNIMECFEEPFYNTDKPGLVLACYRAVHSS